MSYEVNGQTIETNPNGYLENIDEWNEDVAKVIADAEGIDMSDKHWDVVNYLRDEFVNNGGNQPNDRHMMKAMGAAWDEKLKSKDLYMLFPKQPSKQAGKIAGLPESRRKGGY